MNLAILYHHWIIVFTIFTLSPGLASADIPGYAPSDGELQMKLVTIGLGGDDTYITSLPEAQTVLNSVNALLNPGETGMIDVSGTSYDVTTNLMDQHLAIDFGYSTSRGQLKYLDNQYHLQPIGFGSDDQIYHISGGIKFEPGDYTLFAHTQNGYVLTIPGLEFSGLMGTLNSSIISEDTIGATATNQTVATAVHFSIPESLVTTIDILTYETNSYPRFEVSLANGHVDLEFEHYPNALTHGLQGVELNSTPFVPVPEPGSLLFLSLSGIGLGIFQQRRKQQRIQQHDNA